MFKGFKATKNPKRHKGRCGSQFQQPQSKNEVETDAFFSKNVRKILWFTSLEAKKQEANNNWLSLKIKASKQCMCNLFQELKCVEQGLANLLRGSKAPKSYCNIFRGFKAPMKLWLLLLEAKPHPKRYERRITGRKRVKQNIAVVYRGNLKKAKFS